MKGQSAIAPPTDFPRFLGLWGGANLVGGLLKNNGLQFIATLALTGASVGTALRSNVLGLAVDASAGPRPILPSLVVGLVNDLGWATYGLAPGIRLIQQWPGVEEL
ncbi:MAG: hypothetical protein ACFCVD_16055 [Nodosilinea sp.]